MPRDFIPMPGVISMLGDCIRFRYFVGLWRLFPIQSEFFFARINEKYAGMTIAKYAPHREAAPALNIVPKRCETRQFQDA